MWSLHENQKFLEPLKFSNGKTQEDIVKEVLTSIEEGNKIIFIRGVCGTGKSAIALNIAKNKGRTSIIVPIKTLQNQYKQDYENQKYVLKNNGEKLKISVITGRKNHKCLFHENTKIEIPKEKKEINSTLNDIFEFGVDEIKRKKEKDLSADKYDLPCKIEIHEKNLKKIREYLKRNRFLKHTNFLTIKDVKRISIASVCPYWSPVIPEEYEFRGKIFEKANKRTFKGLNNTLFIFYQRKPGCKFYEQFNSYIDSDVVVFNSLKYKLESALNRKPATDIEIIDECDEFLDSLSNQREINIDRLQNSLNYIFSGENTIEKIKKKINEIIKEIKKDKKIENSVYGKAILPLKETKIYNLLKLFLDSPEFLYEIEEENYLFDVEETARLFEDYLDETYLIFTKKDKNLIVNLITTNLAKRFGEILDKNKIIVLMSGTIHSEHVLKNIFGIENFKIIDAEIQNYENIGIKKTGLEIDCKYDNFKKGKVNREQYLNALNKCVEIAEKPVLIHVNSFADLPSKEELEKYKINNLICKEELKEIQKQDRQNKLIEEFKQGKKDVLFSTKCSRGMDFPGTQCNSIIFTKYPNPDVQNAFWKILKRTHPQYYWDFYKDKAKRELLQRLYRGLRFKEDHIYILSPDSRVLDEFEKKI